MICFAFLKRKFSMIEISISVPIKQLKASAGVLTIGSSRTLNEVFTITGHPVFLFNSDINLISVR